MPKTEFTKYIDLYRPICEGLHRTFSGRVEFILHDLSTPEASVVLVVGDLTKRQIGAPATNVLMNALSSEGDDAKDIIGYPSMTKDGKVLKSSTVFIRNDSGKIIGCFCCNVDLTEFNALSAILEELTATTRLRQPAEQGSDEHTEIFAQCVSEVVGDIIRYEIARANLPPSSMSKADKVEIIRSLDKKGVFDVKGTPEMVAGILGTSVFTIYNYLKEVRNDNK
ncbi:helix-turn-helix transcriptional regulator [Feifania hominis]|uniref:PAS domain-containing protein n=1 Tax=Feifania hominis TaxID=2763660 RepID=A0A926DEC2_9FIRM|nr:PAS domain-containing protein [Feifania hominis]MBC8536244.1 PAS domain-containing protein [Feifania hominis]